MFVRSVVVLSLAATATAELLREVSEHQPSNFSSETAPLQQNGSATPLLQTGVEVVASEESGGPWPCGWGYWQSSGTQSGRVRETLFNTGHNDCARICNNRHWCTGFVFRRWSWSGWRCDLGEFAFQPSHGWPQYTVNSYAACAKSSMHTLWWSWSGWGGCDRSCGWGNRWRSRRRMSSGWWQTQWQSQSCYTGRSCAVHGGWTSWSSWTPCSKQCGLGKRHRTRTCSNPYPSRGGRQCYGSAREESTCALKSCAQASSDFPYEGCFASPPFEDVKASDNENGKSPWACAAFCAEKAQSFALSGDTCLCGDKVTASKRVVASNAHAKDVTYCTTECSADTSIQCGQKGKYHSVYRVLLPSSDFTYLGCFKHNTGKRELTKESGSAGDYPAECSHHCEGSAYFGLSEGKCRCGDSYTKSSALTDRECRYECKEKKNVACGGREANSVYVVKNPQPSDDFRHIGCFKVTSGGPTPRMARRADPSDSVFPPPQHASPSECSDFCHGFSYFGLQDGEQCYCLENYGRSPRKETEVRSCRTECANEEGTICGGPNAMSIYLTDNSGPVPVESTDFKSFGCRVFPYSSYYVQQSEREEHEWASPALCGKRCASQGYAYMVLKDYGRCFCTHWLNSNVPDKDVCHLPCARESDTLCGGKFSVSAYRASRYADPDLLHAGCVYSYSYGSNPRDMKYYTSRSDMTPQMCRDLCRQWKAKPNGETYKYSAVFRTTWCMCGDSIRWQSATMNPENCNYPCQGGGRQFMCGGYWSMSLYYNDQLPGPPAPSASSDGFTYRGCFHTPDSESSAKSSGSMKARFDFSGKHGGSLEDCAEFCKNLPFFAIRDSSWCLCGDSEDFQKQSRRAELDSAGNEIPFSSHCFTRCKDDPMVACGGPDREMSVYETARTDESFLHIGCFEEGGKGDLDGPSSDERTTLSPQGCRRFCASEGKLYFGLSEAKRCKCGDSYGAAASVPQWKCHRVCPSSRFISCGGEKRVDVYVVGAEEVESDSVAKLPETSPDYAYHGCLSVTSVEAAKEEVELSGTLGTPKLCAAFCERTGATYFGLRKRGECYCTNTIGDTSDEKNCHLACPNGNAVGCGGALGVSMYGVAAPVVLRVTVRTGDSPGGTSGSTGPFEVSFCEGALKKTCIPQVVNMTDLRPAETQTFETSVMPNVLSISAAHMFKLSTLRVEAQTKDGWLAVSMSAEILQNRQVIKKMDLHAVNGWFALGASQGFGGDEDIEDIHGDAESAVRLTRQQAADVQDPPGDDTSVVCMRREKALLRPVPFILLQVKGHLKVQMEEAESPEGPISLAPAPLPSTTVGTGTEAEGGSGKGAVQARDDTPLRISTCDDEDVCDSNGVDVYYVNKREGRPLTVVCPVDLPLPTGTPKVPPTPRDLAVELLQSVNAVQVEVVDSQAAPVFVDFVAVQTLSADTNPYTFLSADMEDIWDNMTFIALANNWFAPVKKATEVEAMAKTVEDGNGELAGEGAEEVSGPARKRKLRKGELMTVTATTRGDAPSCSSAGPVEVLFCESGARCLHGSVKLTDLMAGETQTFLGTSVSFLAASGFKLQALQVTMLGVGDGWFVKSLRAQLGEQKLSVEVDGWLDNPVMSAEETGGEGDGWKVGPYLGEPNFALVSTLLSKAGMATAALLVPSIKIGGDDNCAGPLRVIPCSKDKTGKEKCLKESFVFRDPPGRKDDRGISRTSRVFPAVSDDFSLDFIKVANENSKTPCLLEWLKIHLSSMTGVTFGPDDPEFVLKGGDTVKLHPKTAVTVRTKTADYPLSGSAAAFLLSFCGASVPSEGLSFEEQKQNAETAPIKCEDARTFGFVRVWAPRRGEVQEFHGTVGGGSVKISEWHLRALKVTAVGSPFQNLGGQAKGLSLVQEGAEAFGLNGQEDTEGEGGESGQMIMVDDVDAWRVKSFEVSVADRDFATFNIEGSFAKTPDKVSSAEEEFCGNFVKEEATIQEGGIPFAVRAVTRAVAGAGTAGPIFVSVCPKPAESVCVGVESAVRLQGLRAGATQDFFGVLSREDALRFLDSGSGGGAQSVGGSIDRLGPLSGDAARSLHAAVAGVQLKTQGSDPWFVAAVQVFMQTEPLVNNRGEVVVPPDTEGPLLWANGWVAPASAVEDLQIDAKAAETPPDFVQPEFYLPVKGVKVTVEIKTLDVPAAASAGPFKLRVCDDRGCLPDIDVSSLKAGSVQNFEGGAITDRLDFDPLELALVAPVEAGLDAWGCEWVAFRTDLGPPVHFNVSAWLAADPARAPDLQSLQTGGDRIQVHRVYRTHAGPRLALSVSTHGLPAAASTGPVSAFLCEGPQQCLSDALTLRSLHLQSGKMSVRVVSNFPELRDNADFRLNGIKLIAQSGDAWYPTRLLVEGLSAPFSGRTWEFTGGGWLEKGGRGKGGYPSDPPVAWTGEEVYLDACTVAQCAEGCRLLPHFDGEGRHEYNAAECLCKRKGQELLEDKKTCGFTFLPKSAITEEPQCRDVPIDSRKECGSLLYKDDALWLGEWEAQQAECEALRCCFEAKPEFLGCYQPDFQVGPKLELVVATDDKSADSGCAGTVEVYLCEAPDHCLSKPFKLGKAEMGKGKTSAPVVTNFPELLDNLDFRVNALRLVAKSGDGWFPSKLTVQGGSDGPLKGRVWEFEGNGWLEMYNHGHTNKYPPNPKPKWIGDDVYLDVCTVKGCHAKCNSHAKFDKDGRHSGNEASCECPKWGFELQPDGVSCGKIVLPETAFETNPQCQIDAATRKPCGAFFYKKDALLTADWKSQQSACRELNCCFEAHLGFLGCYQPLEGRSRATFDNAGVSSVKSLLETSLAVESESVQAAEKEREREEREHFRSHAKVTSHQSILPSADPSFSAQSAKTPTLEDRLIAFYGLSGTDLASLIHQAHDEELASLTGRRSGAGYRRTPQSQVASLVETENPKKTNASPDQKLKETSADSSSNDASSKAKSKNWFDSNSSSGGGAKYSHTLKVDYTDQTSWKPLELIPNPPSIDYLGVGYDLMSGNVWGEPGGTMVDPGFRNPVIALSWGSGNDQVTPDGKWQRATEAHVIPTYSCYRNSQMQEIEDAQSYASSASSVNNIAASAAFAYSNIVSVEVGGGASFTQASSEEVERLQRSRETEMQILAYCVLYKANMSPYMPWKPTAEVIKALVSLPEKYVDCKQCKRYVNLQGGLLSPAEQASPNSCFEEIGSKHRGKNGKCQCYDPEFPDDFSRSTFYRISSDTTPRWYRLKVKGSLTLEQVKKRQKLSDWVEEQVHLRGYSTCNAVCGGTKDCNDDFKAFQKFFKTFGTHVITELQVGARLRHVVSVKDDEMERAKTSTSNFERDIEASIAVGKKLKSELEPDPDDCNAEYCIVGKGTKVAGFFDAQKIKDAPGITPRRRKALVSLLQTGDSVQTQTEGSHSSTDASEEGLQGSPTDVLSILTGDPAFPAHQNQIFSPKPQKAGEEQRRTAASIAEEVIQRRDPFSPAVLSAVDSVSRSLPSVSSSLTTKSTASQSTTAEFCAEGPWRHSSFNLGDDDVEVSRLGASLAALENKSWQQQTNDDDSDSSLFQTGSLTATGTEGISITAAAKYGKEEESRNSQIGRAMKSVSKEQTFVVGGVPPADEEDWPSWAESVEQMPMPVRYSTVDILSVFDLGFRRQFESVVAWQNGTVGAGDREKFYKETREGFEKLRSNIKAALTDYMKARGLPAGINCKYDSVGNILEWGNGGKECEVKCFAEVFAEPEFKGNSKKFQPGVFGVSADDALNFVPDDSSIAKILNRAQQGDKAIASDSDETADDVYEAMDKKQAEKSLRLSSGCHMVKMVGLDSQGTLIEREFFEDSKSTYIAQLHAIEVVKGLTQLPKGTFRMRYKKSPYQIATCAGVKSGRLELVECDDVTARLRFFRRFLEQQTGEGLCMTANDGVDAEALYCREGTTTTTTQAAQSALSVSVAAKKTDDGDTPDTSCQPAYKKDDVVLLSSGKCRRGSDLADALIQFTGQKEEGRKQAAKLKASGLLSEMGKEDFAKPSDKASLENFLSKGPAGVSGDQRSAAYRAVRDLSRPYKALMGWDGLHLQWKRPIFATRVAGNAKVTVTERYDMYCLQPASDSCKAGTPLVLLPCDGGIEQEWIIEEFVGAGCKPPQFSKALQVVPFENWTASVNKRDKRVDFTFKKCYDSSSLLMQQKTAHEGEKEIPQKSDTDLEEEKERRSRGNETVLALSGAETGTETEEGETREQSVSSSSSSGALAQEEEEEERTRKQEEEKMRIANSMVGMKWRYNSHDGDNEFYFRCAEMKNGPDVDQDDFAELSKTPQLDDVKDNDGATWQRKCPGNKIICRWEAEHSNKLEDRWFKFTCCELKKTSGSLGEEKLTKQEGGQIPESDKDKASRSKALIKTGEVEVPRGHVMTGVWSRRQGKGRTFGLYSREVLPPAGGGGGL
uniref:WSC domain-containing protein n=1 Tax=Chromera velia CCMP2878 TaxID=1169474 RepID=A0A0G4GYC4_9ALVE|eukprot:Cvel_5379.t1-p1 / transcript=Cvel_5379.t1 / gene=Cvel_5379 / organism=Chromera_velia_CCMP2878 / gene_product=Thrombospondin-2, putative / transcript_product=Thrombospondin-2, putative / location=Cvel_scaffold250:14304-45625(-) / protein_length=4405 / sequence_SO=supercontig / SO=protein_coding / is_pseudo=false